MNILRSVRWLLLAAAVVITAAPATAQVFISVHIGPPVLPVYVQPMCPAPNLIWTPGHWQWDPDIQDYFWVPGAWVPAPYIGALWTPGYWGWGGGAYMWHAGYWGPHIGYYGGVNYGGGYMGIGFAGGMWNGGRFAYNTAVVNVNRTTITNVYINQTIVRQTTIVNVNHVAYSGGPGGIQHQATPEEQVAEHETHVPPTKFQEQHQQSAKQDKSNFSKNNGGHPTHVAVDKPLAAEPHPAPAGFHPPPEKPVTELAKVQAPPSVQHAAQESSAKSTQEAKAHPVTPPKAGGGKTAEPAGSHAPNPPAHTAGQPAHNTASPSGTEKPPAKSNPPPHPANPTPHPQPTNPAPHPNAQQHPQPANPAPHPNPQPHPQPHPTNPPPHTNAQPKPQSHPPNPPPKPKKQPQ